MISKLFILSLLMLSLSGCVTKTVKTTKIPPLKTVAVVAPEHLLLDVAVPLFDPGLDDEEVKDITIFPELRKAEAAYMSMLLAEALLETGAWGAVRVVPDNETMMDVRVDGTILHSDGEHLKLNIVVTDSRNRKWLDKGYEARASLYAYEASTRTQFDAFQAVYNNIANDLLEVLKLIQEKERVSIRNISELSFAKSFSPDAFKNYLVTNRDKEQTMIRLPAESDPMLKRVRGIREKDFMYVDTLQNYYSAFCEGMKEPYQKWRSLNLEETLALREQQREYRARLIAGGLSVAAGIAATTSDDRTTRAAGAAAVMGGGYLLKSGLEIRNQAQIHVGRLEELGLMLEAKVTPRVIQLEDQTMLLNGTITEQYAQWREILAEIYREETAMPEIEVGENPFSGAEAAAEEPGSTLSQ